MRHSMDTKGGRLISKPDSLDIGHIKINNTDFEMAFQIQTLDDLKKGIYVIFMLLKSQGGDIGSEFSEKLEKDYMIYLKDKKTLDDVILYYFVDFNTGIPRAWTKEGSLKDCTNLLKIKHIQIQEDNLGMAWQINHLDDLKNAIQILLLLIKRGGGTISPNMYNEMIVNYNACYIDLCNQTNGMTYKKALFLYHVDYNDGKPIVRCKEY